MWSAPGFLAPCRLRIAVPAGQASKYRRPPCRRGRGGDSGGRSLFFTHGEGLARPLPRDVIFYDVPQGLVVQIGSPPAGYRYARVANDILLIAVGSGMVIDAIQDLGRM